MVNTNCAPECGRSWGNQPRSICDECFSPLEITYDYDSILASIAQGTFSGARCATAAEHVALFRTAAAACGF